MKKKRRFVVQEHTLKSGEVHYDLMIEDEGVLVTFQLESPQPPANGTRSFDHRLQYLDYEGEISGQRGEVSIWDQGEVLDLRGQPRATNYKGLFRGDRLSGPLELIEKGEGVELICGPR